jgi:hypothetical protein
MSEPPDYVARPYQPVHGSLPSTYQWQAMSQDQLEALRKRLIESIIQVVVQAVTGLFIPGGGMGGASSQLTSWATSVASQAISAIEAIVEALTGQAGGLNLLSPLSWLFPGLTNNGDGTLSSILDELFNDNGDGTWSFIENGIHTLLDSGDGILSSPANLLQSLLGQLGTHQATMDRQQTLIDTLFNSINYTNIFGNQIDNLLDVLRNIPALNVGGVAGPANIGSSVLEFLNAIVGGTYGTPGSGASLANAFDALSWLSGGAFLGRGAFDILGNRGNKPFGTGMLASSVAPIQLPLTGTTPPTFGVTASAATTLWHRFAEPMSLGVIRWWGQTTTNISDMRVAIKKMDPVTGDVTLAHDSANIIGDVSNTLGVNTYTIPSSIAVLANEVYGAEVSVRSGIGTYQIVGEPTWMTNDTHVFPRRISSTRNPGGAAHPSTISSATMSGLYASNIPHMEFAVDTGVGVEYHEPQLVAFPSSGIQVIPTWANFVEVVAVGSGGGGAGGSTAYGINGEHGDPGSWTTATWARGADFTGTPTVTVTVNNGGNGGGLYGSGSNGGNCVAAITGHTVTGIGGSGGSGLGPAAGPGPGNRTYGINPVPPPYTGGAQQGVFGSPGNAPGGAASGGGYLGSGGTGAKGEVWLRFRQT